MSLYSPRNPPQNLSIILAFLKYCLSYFWQHWNLQQQITRSNTHTHMGLQTHPHAHHSHALTISLSIMFCCLFVVFTFVLPCVVVAALLLLLLRSRSLPLSLYSGSIAVFAVLVYCCWCCLLRELYFSLFLFRAFAFWLILCNICNSYVVFYNIFDRSSVGSGDST